MSRPSLYFLLPSFFLFIFCKNKQYFSFMQVFKGFLLCFREKRFILYRIKFETIYRIERYVCNPIYSSISEVH